MKKSSLLLTCIAMMLVVTVTANAQGGCVNSPENPTVVLALVGSAGAFLASARARFKARRNSR
jgi:XrtJ-associated TM-motif-TM protein